MSKKLLVLFLAFFTVSCNFFSQDYSKFICPLVKIPRDTAYLKRFTGNREDYRITVTGYEGFCYLDTASNEFKAVLSPTFVIRRLQPTNESDIHFSFYTETLKGPPEFLGKRGFFEHVNMPLDAAEIEFKGKSVEVRIPENMKYDFDINLGLILSVSDRDINRRTFDTE